MSSAKPYDVALAGGGLAGLAASILLAEKGYSVVLVEKESYPFHRVCGEYISMESWDFISRLGLPLEGMSLPRISTLHLTAPGGALFRARLPQGGFGISRFRLDHLLAKRAVDAGVTLIEKARVEEIQREERYRLTIRHRNGGVEELEASVCCSSHGKRSNLDLRWHRAYLQKTDRRLDNYVGVKYHLRADWPADTIGLHNFEQGYCGISKVEEDWYCLCYLTTAAALKAAGNTIALFEERVLCQNPHLRSILAGAEPREGFPLTISQVCFQDKTRVEAGMLMLGDAAGMITPLCGNGMSIALHTAKIATDLIDRHLQGFLTPSGMEAAYKKEWESHFARRLQTGRLLQRFFGSSRLSNVFVQAFRTFPFLASPVIKMTHGKPF
jgi:flavin-dependent dehydrogenase